MSRIAEKKRVTKETSVEIKIDLDGEGNYDIETTVGFFNHMLELFSKHSGFDLTIKASGDTDVDYHHLVEDTGIVIGEVLNEALGDKRGISRYGFFILPMDETLVQVALDLSGRTYFVFNADIPMPKVGDFDTELVSEFFQAIANYGKLNLHIDLLRGSNSHHIIEGIFKSFARALKLAVKIDGDSLPSTKGTLEV